MQILMQDRHGRIITETQKIDSNYIASQTNEQKLYLTRQASYENKTEFQSKLKVLFDNGFQSEIYQKINTDIAKLNCSFSFSDDDFNIPKKMHYVWLTDKDNPRELFTGDKYQDAWNIEHLYQKVSLYDDWDHTLWVNDQSLIPTTVSIAEKLCVTVKNIRDIETGRVHLADFLAEFDLSHYTLGAYIDITKYGLIEVYGGIVLDINFYLSQKLDDYHLKTYTAIFQQRSDENSFLCFEKGFPRISALLNTILDKFIPACSDICEYDCNTNILFFNSWQRLHYDSDPIFKELEFDCLLGDMDEDLRPWYCKEKQNYPEFFYPYPDKLIDDCPAIFTIGGHDFKSGTWKVDCHSSFYC